MLKTTKKIFEGKKIYWFLFAVGIILLFVIQYYGLVHYKYIAPTGDDAMNHYMMARPFYDGTGNFWDRMENGVYPPLYHYGVANIAKLLHLNLLEAIMWTAPAILIFASLAIFVLAYLIFGFEAALISFFLYAFIAKTPIQLLKDGAYPNLIDAHIFIPLLLIFIVLAIRATRLAWRAIFIFIAIILASLIPLTHHLTTFYLLSTILVSLPVLTAVHWIKNKWSAKKGIALLLLNFLLFFFIFIIFFKTELFASAKFLSGLAFELTKTFPFYTVLGRTDQSIIWSLRDYISYNGPYFALYSLLGLILLPFYWRENKKMMSPIIIVLIWAILLFVASRISFVNYTDRPARDMVVPLSLLAGAGVFYLLKAMAKYRKFACYILLIAFFVPLLSPLRARFSAATSYEPMVQAASADMEVINYLNKQEIGSIMISTSSFYVPTFLSTWSVGMNYGSIEPDSNLQRYGYFYLQDSLVGALPGGVPRGLIQEYEKKPYLSLIMNVKSPTNEVYLFKINK